MEEQHNIHLDLGAVADSDEDFVQDLLNGIGGAWEENTSDAHLKESSPAIRENEGKLESPYLTSKEVAEYYRISQKTLRTSFRAKGLEPIVMGNKFLYRRDQIFEFDKILKEEAENRRKDTEFEIPDFNG